MGKCLFSIPPLLVWLYTMCQVRVFIPESMAKHDKINIPDLPVLLPVITL
jgi:hypothetical protein